MTDQCDVTIHDDAKIYVERILTSHDSGQALLDVLVELEAQASLSVYIFEAIASRLVAVPYWAFYRISQAYFLLGRDDACFLTALSAIRMEPDYPNWHMFENIFRYLYSKGRFSEAVEVARNQIRHTPDIPIIAPSMLSATMRLAHMSAEGEFEPSKFRTKHTLFPAATFQMKEYDRYGISGEASRCYALDQFRTEKPRHEVTVWELDDAEIIVYKRNILVFDKNRDLQHDISICEFPDILAQRVLDQNTYSTLSVHDAETCLVISDKYGTANVCHFLLDHVSRLALYEQFCDLRQSKIVGPSLVAEYQAAILRNIKIDLNRYHGTDDAYIIRAPRLLISETCKKTFVHPAHLASDWALSFLKKNYNHKTGCDQSPKRIYISRRDASVRFVRNEAMVMQRLEECGFVNITLSSHSYDKQVELFANATHVIGMHGAGMTNIVFCPVNANVLEIFHPG